MPHIITPGDRLQFRVWTTANSQAAVNTFYYEAGFQSGTGAFDQDAAEQFDALVAPYYKAWLPSGYRYNGVQCRIANDLPLPVPAESVIHAGAGTGSITGLPKQTAGVISLRTAQAGPGFRGRAYLPFMDVALNDFDGKPTAAAVTMFNNFAIAILGFVTITGSGGGIGATLSIWSRKHLLMTEVVNIYVDTRWGTMKKRGDFGRLNTSPI